MPSTHAPVWPTTLALHTGTPCAVCYDSSTAHATTNSFTVDRHRRTYTHTATATGHPTTAPISTTTGQPAEPYTSWMAIQCSGNLADKTEWHYRHAKPNSTVALPLPKTRSTLTGSPNLYDLTLTSTLICLLFTWTINQQSKRHSMPKTTKNNATSIYAVTTYVTRVHVKRSTYNSYRVL